MSPCGKKEDLIIRIAAVVVFLSKLIFIFKLQMLEFWLKVTTR